MLKEPRIGRVKTRLARDIGPIQAVAAYRRMSANLIAGLSRDPRWRCLLAVTPDGASSAIWPAALPYISQGRGDLGARLRRVFAACHSGPAIVIGSDIAAVRARHIAEAYKALRSADIVFGPAPDGGYWLVGLRRARDARHLFRNVRWSTMHALADSCAGAREMKISRVSIREDIDDSHALQRWSRTIGRRV